MARSVPDTRKTLDELEGTVWPPPAASDTGLVTMCHRLRWKAVGDFTVEDLRIMIGQGIGLRFLVPIALAVLGREPLAEGDFYPGDLLSSVLRVESAFWVGEWELRDLLWNIVHRLHAIPKELVEEVSSFKVACGPTTR